MYARSFRELVVYQKSRDVSRELFNRSRSFPKEEMFSLTDQLRRAARSVGAQIAEAWAKRRYERHFVSKLTDADGEQMETQHWVDEAVDCGYLDLEAAKRLFGELDSIGRMLNQMMLKAPLFCQEDERLLREPRTDYGSIAEFFVSSATHQRSPVTDHSPPPSGHRSLVTDHSPPPSGLRSLVTDH
jgi:four helix bundle protein